jgi:hypothetical protein
LPLLSADDNLPTVERDPSLENLLLLDGEIMAVGGGFSARFVARRVPASDERPHGIMYSLTLHGPGGERVLGYDNAHPLTLRRGAGTWRTPRHDHRHRRDGRAEPYEFRDAAGLLEDFWTDVEDVIRREGMEP